MIQFDYSNVSAFLKEGELEQFIRSHRQSIESVLKADSKSSKDLGWIEALQVDKLEVLKRIENKACEVRESADVFVLIGVGGSNQGARATIQALSFREQAPAKPKILYAGNNLSPAYLAAILRELEGKSVYCNVIAKNFATLEPGSIFRVIRQYIEKRYGEQDAAQRIIATASLNGSNLEALGKTKGYTLFPFPLNVGGRFSVLSPVGLFPIAVAGGNVRHLLQGAAQMYHSIGQSAAESHPIVLYAALRNLLLQKGYQIEILSHFEPCLDYLAAWWVQLFGESEGKQRKGIFPTSCSFTEELHSLGQYIQDGQRILMESFLHIQKPVTNLPISSDDLAEDDFDYLNGKDYAELNEIAYQSTVAAHRDGGVPCMSLHLPELNEHVLGQVFLFFEYACFLSATMLGVNPFDQPGVESYKKNLFRLLGNTSAATR
ncbi:MAG: glucose-6-phosphate isomerase [bacterium]|nr:glucose-6-phosphate isomerase [bacterium]